MRLIRIALAAPFVGAAFVAAGSARGEDVSRELALGLDAFVKLDDRTRLYFLAARSAEKDGPGTEVEIGANIDFTLMPIGRRWLLTEDWTRNRYVWMRAGYRVLRNEAGRAERRPVAEFHARAEPAEALWLFSRLRYEHRDVAGTESWRFRVRLGAERELSLAGHAFVPYAHAEAFYDSRHDAWSRRRYEAGVEVTLDRNWRIEPYLARQRDDRPSPARVDSLGLNVKYYH